MEFMIPTTTYRVIKRIDGITGRTDYQLSLMCEQAKMTTQAEQPISEE